MIIARNPQKDGATPVPDPPQQGLNLCTGVQVHVGTSTLAIKTPHRHGLPTALEAEL